MESLRNRRYGKQAIRVPESAKIARKLNTLLRLTETAWPYAKRRSFEKGPSEPKTATGKRTKEAPLTTKVRRAVKAKMANKLAKKILDREMGNGTRFE